MSRFINWISARLPFRSHCKSRMPVQKLNLRVEQLEDRLVPALTMYTEMADLARLFPPHAGPTSLLLNFDGFADRGVSPFMSVTGKRDQDIQNIIFRVSEVFSPFDVKVMRWNGNGSYLTDNGTTTVFIGDDTENGTGENNINTAFASAANADYPGKYKGSTHRPNSDSYDLAFVDPVFFDAGSGELDSESTSSIARGIAHEAGHTFGLAHVRTDKLMSNPAAGFVLDPTPLPTFDEDGDPLSDNQGTVADVMSYTDRNQFFADVSLPLTAFNNNDGTDTVMEPDLVPLWHINASGYIFSYQMKTQNSFQYLKAALGARPADDFGNVAHKTSVNPVFSPIVIGPVVTGGVLDKVNDLTLTSPLARGSIVNGVIQRAGDYDVFQFTATAYETLSFSTLRVQGGTSVDTTMLVYQDNSLVAFNNNRTATDVYSEVTLDVRPGETFQFVVGANNGVGAGQYRFWVHAPGDPNPDKTGARVLSTSVNYNIKTGVPMSILVTFSEDIDPATFTGADVSFIDAAGVVRHPSSVQVTGFGSRQFLIYVGTIPRADYTFKIGPNINDFAGNKLNQDGDLINGESSQDVYSALLSLEALDLGMTTTRL